MKGLDSYSDVCVIYPTPVLLFCNREKVEMVKVNTDPFKSKDNVVDARTYYGKTTYNF